MKKHWKTIILIGVLLFAVVLAWIALRFALLAYETRWDWSETRVELLAKGEKLSLDDFLPEPIPDERNFFADPIWLELADRIPKDFHGRTFLTTRLPPEEQQLHVLKRALTESERQTLEREFPEFAPLDREESSTQIARNIWEQAKDKSPGERRRAADFVLAALAPSEAMIDRIRVLARRPDALFPFGSFFQVTRPFITARFSNGWKHSMRLRRRVFPPDRCRTRWRH